jgi:hypothetical protein
VGDELALALTRQPKNAHQRILINQQPLGEVRQIALAPAKLRNRRRDWRNVRRERRG